VRRPIGASIVAIVVLAAIAGLALLLEEYGVAQEEPVTPVDSALRTSNRPTYSLCLDGVSGVSVSVTNEQAVAQALSALRQELADRSYEQTVLDRLAGTVITTGCPAAAALSGHRYVDPDTGKRRVAGGPTTNPSQHRVHIYFVPADVFQSWFGDQRYGTSIEETFCEGHQCIPVTHGLYITPAVGQQALGEGLRELLGFVNPFERFGLPTPGQTGATPTGP